MICKKLISVGEKQEIFLLWSYYLPEIIPSHIATLDLSFYLSTDICHGAKPLKDAHITWVLGSPRPYITIVFWQGFIFLGGGGLDAPRECMHMSVHPLGDSTKILASYAPFLEGFWTNWLLLVGGKPKLTTDQTQSLSYSPWAVITLGHIGQSIIYTHTKTCTQHVSGSYVNITTWQWRKSFLCLKPQF